MLRKLMKHELRATGRIMLPGMLILLCATLGARVSLMSFLDSRNNVLILLGSLLGLAYTMIIFGLFIVCMVLMVVRFYKNMMGDEGYLMFTLPANIHQHIWSKLLTSTIWMVLCGIAVILSAGILVVGYAFDFQAAFGEIKDMLLTVLQMDEIKLMMLTVLSSILGIMVGFMAVYASISIGCSFSNNKLLWSFLVFFGFQFVGSFIFGLLPSMDAVTYFFHLQGSVELLMWMSVAKQVVSFVVLYLITVFFLQKKLNLE